MNFTVKNVGIDGCHAGWEAACYATKEVRVFGNFADIIKHFGEDTSYMVDIPIGLADSGYIRICEVEARKLLP